MGPESSPPLRAGTPPPLVADRIIRARKGGNPTQLVLSEMHEEQISQTIDCLVASNGLTDAFLLNAIGPHTRRLNLTSCYHIRKYSLGMIPQQCRNLTSINLANCRQTDNKLVFNLLSNCPNLTELILDNCVKVTDAAFFPPVDLGRLEKLSLAGCRQVSEESLLRIVNTATALNSISLSGCRNSVTSAVAAALMDSAVKHNRLRKIDLSDCLALASDEAFVNFFSSTHLVPLQSIKLAGLSGVPPKYTWRTIQAIAHLCGPHLQELDTSWSTSVTDEACFALATNCPNLVRLNLCNSPLTESGVELLTTSLPNLEDLDLSWCIRVNARAVESIARNAVTIRSLSISNCVDFLRPENPNSISQRNIRNVISNCGQTLERLELAGISRLVTGDVLADLASKAPGLTHFSGSLGGSDSSVWTALVEWGRQPGNSLTSLTLDISRVSDERNLIADALRFPNFPSLKKLSITANSKYPISDELVEAILINRVGLETLELRNCGDISQDLFPSWINGYSPDRETTLVVEAMLEQELQKGYLSSTSIQTVVFGTNRYSDSEAAGTVVFQGRRLLKRKPRRGKVMSSCSETETTIALELLKNSIVLSDAARAIDSLRSLTLVSVPKLTDASIDRLSLMTTYLQSLTIIDAPLLTEECVDPIRRRCRLLRSLEITGPKVRVRIDSSRFSNRRHRRKAAQIPPQALAVMKRKHGSEEDDEDDSD